MVHQLVGILTLLYGHSQVSLAQIQKRSSRISKKEKIRNVTIRQQIGLEETIIKEI